MKLRTLVAFMAVCIITALVAPAFSQEMPAAGTVIDKNNFKKYAHLFPEEFAPAFLDGFGGLLPVFKIKTAETKPSPMPKTFLAFSEKNKGKFGIDAKGELTGGTFDYNGLPFPDLKPGDKDFATKLMWNYYLRYFFDDQILDAYSLEKRRTEPARSAQAEAITVYFTNRISCAAKPTLQNPAGLFKAFLFHYLRPESVKNTISLSYNYVDAKKPDETYVYLPSMRRVLRAEAGQRSTPMTGSTNALDDFNGGFDSRAVNFNYKIVKEQKVLAIVDSRQNFAMMKNWNGPNLPILCMNDPFEVRDTWVVEVKSKDPKYPQSRKYVWVDKESLQPLYTVAWDRAGKVWKVWMAGYKKYPVGVGNETMLVDEIFVGVDVQFGMATEFVPNERINTCKFTHNDVTPASLLKRAR